LGEPIFEKFRLPFEARNYVYWYHVSPLPDQYASGESDYITLCTAHATYSECTTCDELISSTRYGHD